MLWACVCVCALVSLSANFRQYNSFQHKNSIFMFGGFHFFFSLSFIYHRVIYRVWQFFFTLLWFWNVSVLLLVFCLSCYSWVHRASRTFIIRIVIHLKIVCGSFLWMMVCWEEFITYIISAGSKVCTIKKWTNVISLGFILKTLICTVLPI